LAHPASPAEASQTLQKAIDAGSRSVDARTHLAKLRLREGNVASAMRLYTEAIEADPTTRPLTSDWQIFTRPPLMSSLLPKL
jgi:Tfp pilus assembly protein PilF